MSVFSQKQRQEQGCFECINIHITAYRCLFRCNDYKTLSARLAS